MVSDTATDGPAAGDVDLDIEELGVRLLDEDLGLAVLTDEELAALGEPSHPDGPSGWYATLAEPEQQIARNAAFRSLVSRGLLRPPLDAEAGFEVHPSLGLLRTVRREAVGLTSITRTSGQGTDRALLHLVGPGIVLEELLDADGLHACTLRSPERALLAMSTRLDPTGLAGTLEAEPLGGLEPDAEVTAFAEDLLARATATTQITTIRRSHPDIAYGSGLAAAVAIVETDDRLWAIAAADVGAPEQAEGSRDAAAGGDAGAVGDAAHVAGDPQAAASGSAQQAVVVVELSQAELYHTLLRILDPVSPAQGAAGGEA